MTDSVRQFLVAAVDNHTSPAAPLRVFVDLGTHQGIGPHPVDLLARQGERIEVIVGVGVVEAHDVGLCVLCAGQMAGAIGCQEFRAF